jgi:hypothetical protein
MKRTYLTIILLGGLAAATPARAHVPYIEATDYSWLDPFVIENEPATKAIYGWLQTPYDVDVTTFTVTSPVTVQAELDVQVCPAYAQFLPAYAIIGPGLPPPSQPLPVSLPEGYGAIIVYNTPPGDPRETFYEPASQKTYYQGMTTTVQATTPGKWAVIVWDPYHQGGDYVLSTGYEEVFTKVDLLRVAKNLPIIRADGELHTPCPGN